MTFGNWLESELDSACLDLEQDSASKIGLASMMMTPVQTEIDNLYLTWAELEAMDGEDQVAFETRIDNTFTTMYDDGMIAVSDTGITVPTVPDNCDESSKQAVADLA